MLMAPKVYYAAETTIGLNGVKTLSKETVYSYDLNGDGKTVKIKYKITVNEDQYKTALKLYIDDKLCLSKIDINLQRVFQFM